MKTTYLSLPVAFMCLVFGFSLKGQSVQVILSENLDASGNVNVRDVQQTIQKSIDEYALYASLSDEAEGGDLTTQVERGFYNLFTDQRLSDVLQDFYLEITPEDRGTPENYVDMFNRIGSRGLSFMLAGAEITKIQEDPNTGEINATVKVDKKFAELYNRKSQQVQYSGSIRKLLFNYVVFTKEGELKALITSIVNDGKIIRKEDPYRYFSIYAGAGSSVLTPQYNTYWNDFHRQSALDMNGGIVFSGGVEIMTSQFFANKNTGTRKIYPLLGLRYTFSQFSSNMKDLQLPDFDATATSGSNSRDYLRHVVVNEAKEDITLSTIDVPIGVGIRLSKVESISRPSYFLNVRAIPSFGISSTSKVAATGDYDGTLYLDNGSLSQFRILNPNAVEGDAGDNSNWRNYNVGRNETINGETSPSLGSMGFKLEFSPTAYLRMSENTNSWEIMIGLDLGYQFLSNFAHGGLSSVDDESFKFRDIYPESAINQYADNLRGFTFGLRVGVYTRRKVVGKLL